MRFLTLLSAGLVALGTAAVPAAAQTGPKIGYINSQMIIEDAPGAQEAQEQFDRDMARYRTELQQLGEELQQMIQQYEQQQLTLSPEAKENREEQIRQKQSEYQRRAQELDQQAAQRQQELVQPIMDRITRVIEDIRTEGEYALIFDLAAQSIVAADPALDLTEEVIRRLQVSSDTGGGDR